MQFESKITPNVIAKDKVLKQSQNQTHRRFGNFKKRLLRFARNDKDGHNLHTSKYYAPKYAILGTKVNLTMVIFQRHPPLYDFRHHHRNDLKS